MATHHIKPFELAQTLSDSSQRVHSAGEGQQVRRDKLEGNKLETVLHNLNALLEEHLQEWLELPQSERAEVALEALKKL